MRPTPQAIHVVERKPSFLKRMLKWTGIFLAAFVVVGLGGVFFLKTHTEAAATFTDNYLRPLLGADRVIALEKVFFNLQDSVDQARYKNKQPDVPLSDLTAEQAPTNDQSGLDLTPISQFSFKPLDGEGVWQEKKLGQFPDRTVMAYSFVRPDPTRSYALTTLVKMDPRYLDFHSVAGKKEPAGKVGKPGLGIVPKQFVDAGTLVAAFNGGFQYTDGQYGMVVGDTTYLPLKNDLATFVAHSTGKLEIVRYEGQNLGNDVVFARQNCPMLVENGVVGPEDERNKKLWGRTLTSDITTWRTGLGITARGEMVFAIGNSLTPTTLANALKMAGAVDAMQLDINPFWVRFNTFDFSGPGTFVSKPPMKGVQDGTKDYLNGYEKDFFYVTKRTQPLKSFFVP